MKSAAALSLTLCMNVAVVVTLVGQVASQGMISPFPAWPPDGNIPERLQNNYVFLGPRTGEIVVSYPAVLDNPNQTGRRTFTFELHNQVEPTFTVQMAQGSNGVYAYDYLLRNGRSAKQSIRTWSFVGPVDDAGFSVSRQGWSAMKTPTARLQQIALPNVSQGGSAVIFYAGDGNEIPPGGSLDAFRVTSTYAPGFTTAFVKSGSVFDLPSELPTAVGDQVGVLAKPQWDSRAVVILGPRFATGSSTQAIAADFHIGISRLIQTGALSGDSPFVKAALAALATSIESGGSSTVGEIVRLLPKPSPGLEGEIATAMQISPK